MIKSKEKTKICFVSTNPLFLGGAAVFLNNLLLYLGKTRSDLEFTWIYRGEEDKKYKKSKINFIEMKSIKYYPLNELLFNFKVLRFLKKNDYDIINSHVEGFWMNFYKKKNNQKIIQTYHGTNYYFFKCHLKKFNLFKKILFTPLLIFSYFMERPPIKKVDKIICVSDHVKKEIEQLYGKRKNLLAIRTGVDLKKFKRYKKGVALKKLKLDKNKTYGLYVGRGGYWRKGLDRAVKVSEEINKLNKNFILIVVGADFKKTKHLINKKFIIYVEKGERKEMPYYYSAAEFFFCMSRYEGGAPTLVVSEAMASGCLIICSKDSEQEIIKNDENGLIIEDFDGKDAKKIVDILKNSKKKKKIIQNSMKTIKSLSLEKWGKKVIKELLKNV